MHEINKEPLMGLSRAESDVYHTALELGTSLPTDLARRANVKRPTLYKILPSLKKKGLISETVVGKRRHIVAEDPHDYLEAKKAELAVFEEQVPALRTLFNTATVRPRVHFYEGVEGLRKLYMETLKEKKPLLEFVSMDNISSDIEFHARNYYIPQRINKRIPIKILVSGKTESDLIKLPEKASDLREVRVIDQKKFPIPLDCYVWGDNVALAFYRKDSEPIGIIIHSVEAATFLRTMHALAWESAKKAPALNSKNKTK